MFKNYKYLIFYILLLSSCRERELNIYDISILQATEEIKRGNAVIMFSPNQCFQRFVLYNKQIICIPNFYFYDTNTFNSVMIKKYEINFTELRNILLNESSQYCASYHDYTFRTVIDSYPNCKNYGEKKDRFIDTHPIREIDSFLTYDIIVSFEIDTNGKLGYPHIIKKLDKKIDSELLRFLVDSISDWTVSVDTFTNRKKKFTYVDCFHWYTPIGKYDLRPAKNWIK